MTAFNRTTDLPESIDSLEELAVWAISTLAYTNTELRVVEGPGINERAAQAGIFYVEADNKYRFLGRVSIQMAPEYLSGDTKLWTYSQPLSTVPIPAIFKAD